MDLCSMMTICGEGGETGGGGGGGVGSVLGASNSNAQWGQNLKFGQSREPTLIFTGIKKKKKENREKLPPDVTVNILKWIQTRFASTLNIEQAKLNTIQ